MPSKETFCSQIKQSWHAIARMYNNEGAKHDLTSTIGYILLKIDRHEGIPSTQIGPLIGMESTSLVRTLDQMEKKGLIARKKDKNDARRVMIVLTKKGKQKRDLSRKAVKAFNNEIEKKLPKAKLNIFKEVLGQINAIAANK